MTGRTAVVNADDFRRLKAMIRAARQARQYATYLNALERRLRRAQLLPPPRVPGDAVTMNSVVRVRDPHDHAGRRRVLTVVYPRRLRAQHPV